VTALGLLLSLGVPVAVGASPVLAAGLLLLSAVADTIDGALALVTGRNSALGAVYDAVADRIAEACWLVALWRLGTPGWLVVVCGALCWLHEYVRARAAVAGMVEIGAVTAAERPTRVIMVVAGLALSAAAGLVAPELRAGTGTAIAALWAVLSVLGFGQLVHAVREALR
jgi:CDP-diacylglycerol--glycerol-3-phosphate 3-phosphatidyltransferase